MLLKDIQKIPVQKDQKNVLYSFAELVVERQRKDPDLNQRSVNKIEKKPHHNIFSLLLLFCFFNNEQLEEKPSLLSQVGLFYVGI